jgi:hypothetical protein
LLGTDEVSHRIFCGDPNGIRIHTFVTKDVCQLVKECGVSYETVRRIKKAARLAEVV